MYSLLTIDVAIALRHPLQPTNPIFIWLYIFKIPIRRAVDDKKKIKWKILNEQRAIMSSRTNTCLLRVAWICIVCVSTNTPTRNSATPSPMFGHIAVASLFLSGILLIIRIPHRITLFALHMCFRMAINTNARSYDTQHQQYDGRIFWKRHIPCLFTTTAVAAATFS